MFALPSSWLNSRIYDAAMRLPAACLLAYFCSRELAALRYFVIGHPFFDNDLAFLAGLLARIGVSLFLGLLVLFLLLRRRAVRKYDSWLPKLVAMFGMSGAYIVLLLPRANPDYGFDAASALFSLAGTYLCLVAITSLGRSLSVMPEARKLVTDGLYSFIRHPLYLGELIAFVGFFLQFRSWAAAFILFLVLLCQLKRMDWEENILAEAFPEYENYRLNSWRLLPGVY